MKWEPGFPRSQARARWRRARGMRLRSRGELTAGGAASCASSAGTCHNIWQHLGARVQVGNAPGGIGTGQTDTTPPPPSPPESPLLLHMVSPSRDPPGPCPRAAGGHGAAQLSAGKAFGTRLFSEESRGGGMPQRKGSSGTTLREAEAQRRAENSTRSGLGCREKHPHPSPNPLSVRTRGSRLF